MAIYWKSRPLSVDWSAYATQYDLAAENNPWYQALVRHCLDAMACWNLRPGDVVADFGAGTGNFSVEIARAFPQVKVLHLDLNETMLEYAQAKAARLELENWASLRVDLTADEWPVPKLDGAVTVHALYAMPDPQHVIRGICQQLKPGAYLYAADAARVIDSRSWGKALLRTSLKQNGFLKTLRLFGQGGIVRRENRKIIKAQKAGLLWTHELPEFCAAFEKHNMEILIQTDKLYRGVDDVIVARKRND